MSLIKQQLRRSDPTALPAAGVVMEAVVAAVLARNSRNSPQVSGGIKEAVAKHRGIQELLEFFMAKAIISQDRFDWCFPWRSESSGIIPDYEILGYNRDQASRDVPWIEE